jgi:hypothetical protein
MIISEGPFVSVLAPCGGGGFGDIRRASTVMPIAYRLGPIFAMIRERCLLIGGGSGNFLLEIEMTLSAMP